MNLEVADVAAGHALIDVFGSWSAYCEEEDGPGMQAKRSEFLAAYRLHYRNAKPGSIILPGLLPASAGLMGVLRLDGSIETRKQLMLGGDVEP